ncbi:lysophospholipid acyltransferase family protein [Polynucleobacter sp. MWH-Braz-FAM2G]|uniref:lysophospholipid acyltransferase family protein n=1 Tax=Polynucleobacter sp. MWH-Braz-FAM2G TaxID=1855883 RepID=UPI001BFD5D67|nr:lysophospholipid acyltransferase family protein [Polynucleobacter sp. MWH-Braz-FAM2G]QWD90709.1 lysophospholipid acyltransferase family protein [Polynucleobacter sp. MWH-Braz-FAM2G]
MRKLLLKLSLNTIAVLPLAFMQLIGASLGLLAYVGSKHYRSLFRPQYEAVVSARKLPLKLWEAARASGMLFSDSLWIWRNPVKALKLVEVQNWDVVEAAIGEGHGLVMLTPHLGGFEIIPRVLAQHFPATILYRPSRQEWLNEVVEEGRAYPNMHFVPTNLNGVRQMTRALTRGEAIGILPDQVPSGGEGVWVPFFGRPAYTTPLPARLANRNNTPVIMFTAKRKGIGKGWVMQATRLAPFSEDAERAATELNIAIENAVLQAPEQFIWSYNRYKHPAGAELPPSN